MMIQTTGMNHIKSILYPKPINIKFERDGIKFIGFMSILGLIGFIFSTVVSLAQCLTVGDVVAKSLDLVTVIVPPALPAALTVGIVYAQHRLKKSKIFTIQPQRINLAGAVNVALFDKTGTITEDGLHYEGILAKNDKNELDQLKPEVTTGTGSDEIRVLMGVCHSLAILKDKLVGDPLEIEMFSNSKMEIEINQSEIENQVSINDVIKVETDSFANTVILDKTGSDDWKRSFHQLKHYPFSSEFARGSVLVKEFSANDQKPTSGLQLFTKGAPEVIKKLCRPESIPSNFELKLEELSVKGYRILAFARRNFQDKSHRVIGLSRSDAEVELDFVGFLVFKNNLKSNSFEIIHELNRSNIKTAMITGDNILTAVAVSKDVGILDDEKDIYSPVIQGKG